MSYLPSKPRLKLFSAILCLVHLVGHFFLGKRFCGRLTAPRGEAALFTNVGEVNASFWVAVYGAVVAVVAAFYCSFRS